MSHLQCCFFVSFSREIQAAVREKLSRSRELENVLGFKHTRIKDSKTADFRSNLPPFPPFFHPFSLLFSLIFFIFFLSSIKLAAPTTAKETMAKTNPEKGEFWERKGKVLEVTLENGAKGWGEVRS